MKTIRKRVTGEMFDAILYGGCRTVLARENGPPWEPCDELIKIDTDTAGEPTGRELAAILETVIRGERYGIMDGYCLVAILPIAVRSGPRERFRGIAGSALEVRKDFLWQP